MLTLLLGRAGSGKSYAVFDRLEKLARQGNESLFLLVPEQYSFASERELLLRLGAPLANRVTVVSFTRLADTVLREVGGMASEALDDGARALLMSRALSEVAAMAAACDEPLFGVNPHQVTDAAYVEQLLNLWEEMRVCAVSTEELERVSEELAAEKTAAAHTLQEKVCDYSRIFAAYQGLVTASGLDDTDKLARLVEKLPDSTLLHEAVVMMDGFKGFTAQELAVVEHLITCVKELTLTLCTDTVGRRHGATAAAAAREDSLFAPVTGTVRRLRELAARHGQEWTVTILDQNRRHTNDALCALEAGVYHPTPAVWDKPTDAVTVTPCLDVYEECTYVARRIRCLMREDAVRCRDITVVARDLSVYDGLLEDALDEAGIPYSLDKRQPIIDEPLLVYIRAALRVAVGGFRTEAVFRLLKTDLSALSLLDTARLENYVYLWNVDGSAWTRDWTENPAGLGVAATPVTARQLAELNALRRQVAEPLSRLREALRGGTNGRAFALAVYRFLTDDKGLSARIIHRVSELENMNEPLLAERSARVWDETMNLLDRFAGVLGDYIMPATRLEELFSMLAQMIDLGQIPQGLDSITIGAADRIRYHRPRVVFVLGANEGVFPAYPSEDGLLDDDDRRMLAAHDVIMDEDLLTQCIEERYYAYMALAAPHERLFVSYHTMGDAVPSPLVSAIDAILPQHSHDVACDVDGVNAETADEMFARAAENDTRRSVVTASLRQVLAEEPLYVGRLAAVDRAAGNQPFFMQDTAMTRRLFGEELRLSASQTEKFYQCRFAYFCQYGLRLQARQKATVDAASFGTIVHYVMETLLPRYTAADGLIDRLKAEDAARTALDDTQKAAAENATQEMLLATLSEAVHQTVMDYVTQSMGSAAEKSACFLYRIELAERSAYNMLWHTVMELRQSEFRPVAFELGICPDDDGNTAPTDIPSIHLAFDGGRIRLRGKVDRVDLYVRFDGKAFVRVVDYKTGSKTFDLHELSRGLNMQMLLYLYTICDQPERLVPATESLIPAGVLYHPLSDLTVSRDAGDKAAQKRLKSMRMDGLVLDDASVVQAMEANPQKIFIPATIDKGGRPTGSVITEQHFKLLRGVVEQLLVNMATTLHEGDIAAMPIQKGDYTPCQYCDYRAVCARDEDAPTNDIGKRDMKQVLEDLQADEEVTGDG